MSHLLSQDGDVLFVLRVNKWLQPDYKNIVCALSPINSKVLLCKRLILKELDFVEEEEGHPRRIPKGYCYIRGDNQAVSIDSRNFGPIPLGLIRYVAFWRIWPLERLEKLH